MNNSNELILRKLTNEFEEEIDKNRIIIAEKLTREKWWIFNRLTKEIESNISNEEDLLRQIHFNINTEYGMDCNDTKKLITMVEDRTKQNCLKAYLKQSQSREIAYEQIITGMKSSVQAKMEAQQLENKELIARLETINAEALKFKEEATKNVISPLPPQERIELENIRIKFNSLETLSLNLEEKIIFERKRNLELERSLEALENNYHRSLLNLDSIGSHWKITRVELGLVRAECESLKVAKSGLLELKNNWEQRYLGELYVVTKLGETLLKLNDLIAEIEIEAKKWKNKYNHSTLTLNFKEDQLTELKRIHQWEKIKLGTVLVLDSTRNFLPTSIGNYITKAETVLLVSEINSTSSKFVWSSLACFMIFSFLSGISKLTQFSKSLISKLSNTKKNKEFSTNEINSTNLSQNNEES